MAESADIDRELSLFESELKRLEAEYNMFFAGRLARPPWETRRRVEAIAKRLDRQQPGNYGHRFRFGTLQSRLATFVDLWDRGLRAREEGRPGPFAQPRPAAPPHPTLPEDRVVHVATFSDPLREIEKLRDLYHSVSAVRRQAGQEQIPFHRFADMVTTQVATMQERGSAEVAFRVAVKDGRINLTARGMKE